MTQPETTVMNEDLKQPATRMELELSEALVRIGEELGLGEVTAFNCIDAIRRMKSAASDPHVEVPLLEWFQRNDNLIAESAAGTYLIYERNGQVTWGIVDITDGIPCESWEAGKLASQQDWGARLKAAAMNPVRRLNWSERDGSSWTTSRVVRYRVYQITHGEGKGQWVATVNDRPLTHDTFPDREGAKDFCQGHWQRDQQILYAIDP